MVNTPLITTTHPDDTGHPPLLDPAALDSLLDSLESDESALDGFVARFMGHWPARLQRAELSIRSLDTVAAQDCALSIKVAAQMVGAMQLAAYGAALESLARTGRLHEAEPFLPALQAVGDATLRELAVLRKLDLAA
ncbi:Hpt domain-containing protein [Mycetocola manganoxydans]|uniref:Hpt domain-containing protein n=1 Tax=Mycetocola manganoxydans TaxID=699879 RepID=A0A3L6ZYW0_9MICO|nr:Hpt domain-containing protein [Mycetocola manganoxydans]RLP72910.1 Hpt domain-containing protein [Mycetocola manganoxydans]GHD45025.1 hypothetical protein GCM10008097_13770 [Mycetocola manganoxydans]